MKTKMKGRICTKCKKYKKASEFRCGLDSPDILRSHCRKCEHQYRSLRRQTVAGKKYMKYRRRQARIRNQTFIREAKNRPCADCGIAYMYEVMDFDHVNGKKTKNVSLMLGTTVKQLKAEIAKCDVVCANCHREREHGRKNKKKCTGNQLYARNRALMYEAKNKSCVDCNVVYPYYIMSFDHVSGEKIKNVNSMLGATIKQLKTEIAKCEVVCGNCHRIRTYSRRMEEK